MSFNLYHTNPVFLYRYFKCLNSINDNIKLFISKDGIKVSLMNNSQTVFISSILHADCFENFTVDNDVDISFNLSLLTKILNRAESNDTVTLIYNSESEDCLNLKLENNNRISEFNICLINLDCEINDIADLNHSINLDIHIPRLQSICNDIKLIEASELTFRSVRNNKLKIISNGDSGGYKIKLKENSKCLRKVATDKYIGNKVCKISVQEDEYVLYPYTNPVNVSFSLNMLEHILSINPILDKIKLSIGNDMPLLAYAQFNNSYIKYYISPKIID